MARRHDARLAAVSLVYAYNMGNIKVLDNLDSFLNSQKIKGKQAQFSRLLLEGFLANKEIIDELISQNLTNWSFDRLGAVERAILRIATFEIVHTSTDLGVIINEAIEISKELTQDNAHPLINGVLDKLKTQRKPLEVMSST